MELPIKIYVGATAEQLVPCRVLEHSIRKTTSLPIELLPLYQSGIEIPVPKDPENRPFTTFSFQRFTIPQIQRYQGRAIYFDSDMIVFRDIQELWQLPFNNAQALAVLQPDDPVQPVQYSVLLLDCQSLNWNITEIVSALDDGRLSYQALMRDFAIAQPIGLTIPPCWNSLDHYNAQTALLHYTRVHTQPWLSAKHPLGYLWFRLLFEAIDQGLISKNLIKEDIAQGNLRPSLWWQIEQRQENSLNIPKKILADLDKNFIIPNLKKFSLKERARFFVHAVWKRVNRAIKN